jgi:hypothetical protein
MQLERALEADFPAIIDLNVREVLIAWYHRHG